MVPRLNWCFPIDSYEDGFGEGNGDHSSGLPNCQRWLAAVRRAMQAHTTIARVSLMDQLVMHPIYIPPRFNYRCHPVLQWWKGQWEEMVGQVQPTGGWSWRTPPVFGVKCQHATIITLSVCHVLCQPAGAISFELTARNNCEQLPAVGAAVAPIIPSIDWAIIWTVHSRRLSISSRLLNSKRRTEHCTM